MKQTPSPLSAKAIQTAQPALIESIDESALLDLLSRGTIQNIPAGTTFVRQGQSRMSGLYMILEGMVGQLESIAGGDRHLTCAMGPGEFLGEVSNLGEVQEGLSSVTLKTHSACQLIYLPKAEVESWFDQHPAEQTQFMRYLAREQGWRREFSSSVIGNA
jgi:CRP-like cAMP-binding protein